MFKYIYIYIVHIHTCTIDITCFIINIFPFTTSTVLSWPLFIFRSFGIGLSSGSLARQAPSLEAHQQDFQVLQTLADNLLLGMEVLINISLPEDLHRKVQKYKNIIQNGGVIHGDLPRCNPQRSTNKSKVWHIMSGRENRAWISAISEIAHTVLAIETFVLTVPRLGPNMSAKKPSWKNVVQNENGLNFWTSTHLPKSAHKILHFHGFFKVFVPFCTCSLLKTPPNKQAMFFFSSAPPLQYRSTPFRICRPTAQGQPPAGPMQSKKQ